MSSPLSIAKITIFILVYCGFGRNYGGTFFTWAYFSASPGRVIRLFFFFFFFIFLVIFFKIAELATLLCTIPSIFQNS